MLFKKIKTKEYGDYNITASFYIVDECIAKDTELVPYRARLEIERKNNFYGITPNKYTLANHTFLLNNSSNSCINIICQNTLKKFDFLAKDIIDYMSEHSILNINDNVYKKYVMEIASGKRHTDYDLEPFFKDVFGSEYYREILIEDSVSDNIDLSSNMVHPVKDTAPINVFVNQFRYPNECNDRVCCDDRTDDDRTDTDIDNPFRPYDVGCASIIDRNKSNDRMYYDDRTDINSAFKLHTVAPYTARELHNMTKESIASMDRKFIEENYEFLNFFMNYAVEECVKASENGCFQIDITKDDCIECHRNYNKSVMKLTKILENSDISSVLDYISNEFQKLEYSVGLVYDKGELIKITINW